MLHLKTQSSILNVKPEVDKQAFTKNYLFMRDIILRFHPDFEGTSYERNRDLKKAQHFNIPSLIEQSLAAVGGYDFIDAEGYDFSDYSDSKTVSINPTTGRATIGSVENKIGALRVIVYNPIKNGIDYFFVPADEVAYCKGPCYGKTDHKERIRFSYSKVAEDSYGWFEDYRVDSFEELAKCK